MKTNRGMKYWIILAACSLLAATSVGIVMNTIGVFYTPVSQALGVSTGTFTLHATFCMLTVGFISLVIPQILKHISIKQMVLIGSVLVTGSTILMGFSNHIIHFYLLGILRGLGAGLFSPFTVTMVINNWFYKQNGLATSIALSFSGIAGAILSPVFTGFISHFGWNTTYVIVGILSLLFTLPFLLYPFQEKPELEGKLPYGLDVEIEIPKSVTNVENEKFDMKNRNFILLMILCLIVNAVTGVSSHLPTHASNIGLAATVGSLMLSLAMVGNISFKLIIGILTDLFGILKANIMVLILCLLSLVLLLFFKSTGVMYMSSLLLGSIYGVTAVGISLLTRHLFGASSYSAAYSKVMFVANISAASGVSIFGYVYDFTGSYTMVFVIGIVILVASILLMTLMKPEKGIG